MNLQVLAAKLDHDAELPAVEIAGVVYDSRRAVPGGLFVCIPGEAADGHDYAPAAYEKGARVFVCERRLELPADALILTVPDARIALARLSAAFFGRPAEKITMIGVTGTKGKSTVTYMLKAVLEAAGETVGVIGTNGIEYCDIRKNTINTTPESYELHKTFREMADRGVTVCVMEVSSQGLKMHRTHGIAFEAGIFTNLSPDHIGKTEHETMEEYVACKAMLFAQSRVSVVNLDDERAADMLATAAGRKVTFGIENPNADLRAQDLSLWKTSTELGVGFDIARGKEIYPVQVCQPGRFSVYNGLAVIGAAEALGVPRPAMLSALKTVTVAGRAQIIPALPYLTVIIDYAHNALSLESILKAARAYEPRRVVCLFGSVGGRTQMRRPTMGAIASKWADLCVLTADNPNFEDPMEIIRDIRAGFETSCPYVAIPDRRTAIRETIKNGQAGDLILLCGKGHETYQLIRGVREPFCEADIVREVAEEMKAACGCV